MGNWENPHWLLGAQGRDQGTKAGESRLGCWYKVTGRLFLFTWASSFFVTFSPILCTESPKCASLNHKIERGEERRKGGREGEERAAERERETPRYKLKLLKTKQFKVLKENSPTYNSSPPKNTFRGKMFLDLKNWQNSSLADAQLTWKVSLKWSEADFRGKPETSGTREEWQNSRSWGNKGFLFLIY